MKAQKELRKPHSWQDFEKLCKKLWGEVWCCPNIKQNGRQGQNQNGVDVFGVPSGEKAYFGNQCKLKDGYTDSKLTKKEIDARVQQIIDFSELGDFIDTPVRTYSSGMYMRLAFSVAINVDADILLIDEILAVGDQHFQSKCFEKLMELKN